MSVITGRIAGTTVKVILGDITQSRVGAIVVPEFNSCASYGGVGGAVAQSGAVKGMKQFDKLAAKKGRLQIGTALLTESGGGNSGALLHVVSLDSDTRSEFHTVKKSFLNALKVAEKNNIESIAAPALGAGSIGSLQPKKSAEAMMSAIQEYREAGGRSIPVEFVIFGDRAAYAAFASVLTIGVFAGTNANTSDPASPKRQAPALKAKVIV